MIDAYTQSEISDFRTAYHEALARIADLKRVLGLVEFVQVDLDGDLFYCPWCRSGHFSWNNLKDNKHALDCPRQAALRDRGEQ